MAEVQAPADSPLRWSRGLEPDRSGRLFKKEPWSLRPGEEIVARSTQYFRDQFRWTLIFGAAILLVGLPVAAAVNALTWIGLRLTRPEYILTTERVLFVDGWLNRGAKSVSLDRIQEVTYHRGFFERVLWGTGTFVVETAATEGTMSLPHVADADPFRVLLEAQVRMGGRVPVASSD